MTWAIEYAEVAVNAAPYTKHRINYVYNALGQLTSEGIYQYSNNTAKSYTKQYTYYNDTGMLQTSERAQGRAQRSQALSVTRVFTPLLKKAMDGVN